MEDAGDDSIDVVVVISPVVPAIIVVGVRVVGLQGAAMFSVVFVFVGAGGFLSSASSGGSLLLRRFKSSLFLRLFLLSWSHKEEYRGKG